MKAALLAEHEWMLGSDEAKERAKSRAWRETRVRAVARLTPPQRRQWASGTFKLTARYPQPAADLSALQRAHRSVGALSATTGLQRAAAVRGGGRMQTNGRGRGRAGRAQPQPQPQLRVPAHTRGFGASATVLGAGGPAPPKAAPAQWGSSGISLEDMDSLLEMGNDEDEEDSGGCGGGIRRGLGGGIGAAPVKIADHHFAPGGITAGQQQHMTLRSL